MPELTTEIINANPMLEKFRNERKCEFCKGFWIFKEGDDEKYCPNCEELAKKQIRKKDMLYKESTNEQLDERVGRLESSISDLAELVKQILPKKEKPKPKYKSKKCLSCENEFTPKFPAQKRCSDCVGEDE